MPYKRRTDDSRGGARPNTGNSSYYRVKVNKKFLDTPNSATAQAYVIMAEFLGYKPTVVYGKPQKWVEIYPLIFEIGDLVYIDSVHALQHGEQGMVVDLRPVAIQTYQVQTTDGSKGWYRAADLSTQPLEIGEGILTVQYNSASWNIADFRQEELREYLLDLYPHITAIEYEPIVTHDLVLGPKRVVAKGMRRAIYHFFKEELDNDLEE